jgi:hypothetical protein
MILILTPDIHPESETYRQLMNRLNRLQNIQLRVHLEQGAEHSLTEIYLIGNTVAVSLGRRGQHDSSGLSPGAGDGSGGWTAGSTAQKSCRTFWKMCR